MTREELQREMQTMTFQTGQMISPLPAEPAGTLKINNSLRIAVYGKLPCRFHRLMMKLLLGWIYEETGKNE